MLARKMSPIEPIQISRSTRETLSMTPEHDGALVAEPHFRCPNIEPQTVFTEFAWHRRAKACRQFQWRSPCCLEVQKFLHCTGSIINCVAYAHPRHCLFRGEEAVFAPSRRTIRNSLEDSHFML